MAQSKEPKITCVPLRGKANFSGIFRKSKKITGDKLYAFAVLDFAGKETENTEFSVQFAVNVRKKNVRHAVCRNRIRRLVRTVVREKAHDERYNALFCALSR